jgi:hypothetical protein
VFFAQPLQLNRQGCALFFAHFAMRHAAFGPNHARRSKPLLARLCNRAPEGASGRRDGRRGRGHEALILVVKIGFELTVKPARRACKE